KSMNRKTCLKSLCAALLAVVSTAYSQSSPWQTLYEGDGRVYTALIDPFADVTNPQPSLFFGGLPYLGYSVRWAGPLGIAGTDPMSVDLDADAGTGTVSEIGFDSASGLLYSVGTGASGWQVRQSSAEGAPGSWSFADVPYPTGSGASGVASDGNGNV